MPKLALYYYPSCYYCRLVQQALAQAGLEAELRNIHENREWAEELRAERGRYTVPVLRIETPEGAVTFMGESRDIVRYLASLAA